MNDELSALTAKLKALREEWGEEVARAALVKHAADLAPAQREQLALLAFGAGSQVGDVTIGDVAGDDIVSGNQGVVEVSGTLRGAAVGVNQGTLQLFFGATPPADGKQLLNAYLDALGERYRPLALGRLLRNERHGDERSAAPTLPLRAVYTALATDARLPRERFELTPEQLERAVTAADPDRAPPDRLRFPVADLDGLHELAATLRGAAPGGEPRSLHERGSMRRAPPPWTSRRDKEQRIAGQWYEPELAVEALAAPRARVVLLGDPGSGKSTVLRYLVVSIAEALLAGSSEALADLRGWAGQPLPVPLFCPLGPVAKALDDNPAHDLDRLVNAVLAPILGAGGLRAELRTTLLRAWHGGGVLLCFDGLDEVSSVPEATNDGELSRRERLADALRRLAQELGDSRVVVTCRTRPYQQDSAWQLPEPWRVRRIEPFTFGQVRFFVETWYAQSCAAAGAKLTPEEGQQKAAELIDAIPAKPGLSAICESPLLLTMVVLLHFNQKQLPDERAEVYEELVGLLLDRWEWVRSSDKEQVKLVAFGERLELPQLRARDLRAAVNQIAYEAHRTAQDGRGVIAETLIYQLLDRRFRNALNPARPDQVKKAAVTEKIEIFLDLLVHESGLVQPDGDGSYVLPHLTFEEYLAACYLAEQEDVELAYERWCEGGDRWREPLLLLMGCLRLDKKHRLAESWIETLLDETFGTEEKPAAQRQRDAVLAAACYRELGGRRYMQDRWHPRKVDELEQRLRAALLELLEQPVLETLLPLRVEAGTVLGALGDPRFPVTAEQWGAESARCNEQFGQPAGYWCYVRPGTYRIGGWEDEQEDAMITLPAFWIARFPITVAQFAPFVSEGYGENAEQWWTAEGWKWWQEQQFEPRFQNRSFGGSANQPATEGTWYDWAAFCTWLNARLAGMLPSGYVIRLPTEAEWEAAAVHDLQMRRHLYPWGDVEPTPELAIYNAAQLVERAPVGCCIAGAAACGALDLAGNVWEATTSSYHNYPKLSHISKEDFAQSDGDISFRQGGFRQDKMSLRGGTRSLAHSMYFDRQFFGFRLVLALRSPA